MKFVEHQVTNREVYLVAKTHERDSSMFAIRSQETRNEVAPRLATSLEVEELGAMKSS